MLFLPAVGFALVLPAVGYALLAVLVPVLLSSFFSPLALWLWFCLCFLQRHFVVVYDSVVRFWHLQHHYSALSHFVIVVAVDALVARIGSLQQ